MPENPLRAFGANIAEGLKSFGWFTTETTTTRNSAFWYPGRGGAPSSNYNYAAEAGDLWRNSTVFSCLNWIRRTFPEAPIAVAPIDGGDPDPNHPLAQLIRHPNPVYGRSTLLGATAFSYVVDGNAYWFKRRDSVGVRELWYRPHWMVRPRRRPGSTNFIDYYEYSPPGMARQEIPLSEVVHLRNGIDPDCEMLGMSDLKALLRSVVTDNQAQNFTASMLRNMGVPGAILTVKNGANPPTPEQAQKIKDEIQDRISGDNIGKPLFVGGPMDVTFPEVAIDGAALEAIKSLSQADISAAIGIPAVVVGLLVGLKTSTAKASYADARGQAYESCIVPNQSSIAEDLDIQLLPDLGNPAKEEVVWDYSNITVMGESTDAKHERVREDYKALLCDRFTALTELGMEATETDKGVYYNGSGGASTAGSDMATGDSTARRIARGQQPEDPVLAATGRNGNGQ